MEPEKIIPGATPVNKEEVDSVRKTMDGLHDEGVDILGDDRVPDYIESYAPRPSAPKGPPTPPRFATPAPAPAPSPALEPVPAPMPAPVPMPVPAKADPAPVAPAPEAVLAAPIAPVAPATTVVSPAPAATPISAPTATAAPQPSAPAPAPAPRPEASFYGPQQPIQTAAPARSAQSDIDMILGGAIGGGVGKPNPVANVQNNPSIKPLRTFKSDAEEAIRYQNISAAQIAVAEQKKREAAAPAKAEAEQAEEKTKSKIGVLLTLLFALVIAGGGGYYYWFYMKSDAPPAPRVPAGLKVSSHVPYDEADIVAIEPDENALVAIAQKLAAAPVQVGETFVVVPVPIGTTTVAATIASVLSDTRIPPMLERSLAPQYTIGTRLFSTNSPFLVLKNTFFQNAYAGMLEWEGTMRADFISFIRLAHPEEAAVELTQSAFADAVVSNIDARILRNAAGQTILAYAFADRDTAVIATDEETLSYLLDKLLAVRVVQ